MTHRLTKLSSFLLVLVFVGMQFVPTAAKPNALARGDVRMAQVTEPRVGAILDRSCRDCHSSNTNWPWYGKIAPVSWFLSRDVSRGRMKLDFSDWTRRTPSGNERMEVCDAVSGGNMPLRAYTLIHHDARLSEQDVELICDWAAAPQPPPSLRAGGSAAEEEHHLSRKRPQ